MQKNRIWIIASAVFLAMIMVQGYSAAQTAQQPTAGPRGGQNHSAMESNPSCQRIISECRRVGFVQGQWKRDNGLWKDCVDPVLKGGTPTQNGKPVEIPVSSSDIEACRAARHGR